MNCRRENCDNLIMRSGGRGFCQKHYTIELRKERPDSKWVSPEPARRHIKHLRRKGVAFVRISEKTGLSKASIYNICYGKTQKIQLHNERLIMAVHASGEVSDRPEAMIPAFSTSRRLKGLCRMGFTQRYLAGRLGISTDAVDKYLRLHGPWVQSWIAEAVVGLFDELQMTPLDDPVLQTPTAKRVRTLAERQAWPLPFAWLEDELDDPRGRPAIPRGATATNRTEQYEGFRANGLNDAQIAKKLGIDPSSLSRWLQREREKAA